MLKITSRNNDRLTHIRRVRDGKVRGEVFIEGLRLGEEAVRSGIDLKQAVFTAAFAETQRGSELLDQLQALRIELAEADASIFKSVTDTANSQGIALTAARPKTGVETFPTSVQMPLYVYLHEISDPSNLGAIFRTAEAAGVSGVVLSNRSADPFSPKALRAGMGANLRVPIWDQATLEECIAWAQKAQLRIAAADIRAPHSYTDLDWKAPTLLMFGSEAHGLDPAALSLADTVVKIPMKNNVESLNLAVSAGIVLFEAVRQRS